MKIPDEAALFAANWWADQTLSISVEQRTAFRDELASRLRAEIDDTRVRLYCDYDPQDMLLEALRAAGIECRGFLFSAHDIGMPTKTCMYISSDGCVEAKEGYGQPFVQIFPTPGEP